jgi:hypothetical protein
MLIQIDQASGFRNEKKRSSGLTFDYYVRILSCKNMKLKEEKKRNDKKNI